MICCDCELFGGLFCWCVCGGGVVCDFVWNGYGCCVEYVCGWWYCVGVRWWWWVDWCWWYCVDLCFFLFCWWFCLVDWSCFCLMCEVVVILLNYRCYVGVYFISCRVFDYIVWSVICVIFDGWLRCSVKFGYSLVLLLIYSVILLIWYCCDMNFLFVCVMMWLSFVIILLWVWFDSWSVMLCVVVLCVCFGWWLSRIIGVFVGVLCNVVVRLGLVCLIWGVDRLVILVSMMWLLFFVMIVCVFGNMCIFSFVRCCIYVG